MASYMPTLALRSLNQGLILAKAAGSGGHAFKVALITSAIPTGATRDSVNETYGGSDFTTHGSSTNYDPLGADILIQEALYTATAHRSAVSSIAASLSWSGTSLTGVTGAILYDNTTATKYVMAVFDFNGAQSVVGNTFQINWTSTTPNYTLWYLDGPAG